jgi:uncharacterized protein (TIGR00661 family)
MSPGLVLAVFATSHGFGHASRVAAILSTLLLNSGISKIIFFGKTPIWFWKKNIDNSIKLLFYEETIDVGLVQKGPFEHDLSQTVKNLKAYFGEEDEKISRISSILAKFKPNLILSDISPLGVLIGNKMGIPCVMTENFTWPWIYKKYENYDSFFTETIERFNAAYRLVGLRIQCTPYCSRVPGAKEVPPVFRFPKKSFYETKKSLGIKEWENFILVTTGGIPMQFDQYLPSNCDFKIVIPGNWDQLYARDSIIFLPMNSDIFFTDLVNSSSAVIGKAGYGTISEAWGLRKPFYGIYRKNFQESEVLREFANQNMMHEEIDISKLKDLRWIEEIKLPEQNANPRQENGAEMAAKLILEFIEYSLQ